MMAPSNSQQSPFNVNDGHTNSQRNGAHSVLGQMAQELTLICCSAAVRNSLAWSAGDSASVHIKGVFYSFRLKGLFFSMAYAMLKFLMIT